MWQPECGYRNRESCAAKTGNGKELRNGNGAERRVPRPVLPGRAFLGPLAGTGSRARYPCGLQGEPKRRLAPSRKGTRDGMGLRRQQAELSLVGPEAVPACRQSGTMRARKSHTSCPALAQALRYAYGPDRATRG